MGSKGLVTIPLRGSETKNDVPISAKTVVENIRVIVLSRLSILTVGSLGISRKVVSYHLRNKNKSRLKTTFLKTQRQGQNLHGTCRGG